MEILGIGMPELIFVIIIALLILGPKDMQKAGKTIGKFLRSVITSDGWRIFQQTSRDLRTLPNRLMREANEELEQVDREIRTAASFPAPARSAATGSGPQPKPFTPPPPPAAPGSENSIAPTAKENNNPESEPSKNA